VWVCLEAGRQLADDRENGALELLLSTPLSVREILRGQRLSLQRQFLQPLVTIAITFVILMFASIRTDVSPTDQNSWIKIWLAGIVLLVTDVIALYWVGMWQALRATHPNRAAIGTAVRILILPWIAFLLIASVVVVTRKSVSTDPESFFFSLWIGLGLVADIGFACWARYRLLSGFRLISAERPGNRSSLLKRLFAPGKIAEKGDSIRPEPEVGFRMR
jgi:ABC-type transport system involved in cytochrome c biogenesis permease component